MKKRNIVNSLALAASLVLIASCDVAHAPISNGTDKGYSYTGYTAAVDKDTLQDLYDIVREDSSFSSEIASMLNYEIAKNYVGNYTINSNGEIELEGWDYVLDEYGTRQTNVTNEQKIAFIQNHQMYWNWVDAGIRITYEDAEDVTASQLSTYEGRINSYKELIKKEIVITMFDNINSSAYKYNSAFYEILYVQSLMDSLNVIYSVDGTTTLKLADIYSQVEALEEIDYEVGDNHVSANGEFTQGVFIDSSYDPNKDTSNIIDGNEPLLHLEHYTQYINSTIVPGIINNLLTEQYILRNQYAAIGRTQQRKIEYIQIANNEDNDAYSLLRSYARNSIDGSTVVTEDNLDFSPAATAWMGIPEDLDQADNADAKAIAGETFGNVSTEWQNSQVVLTDENRNSVTYIDGTPNNGYTYYDGSVYGDLIGDYSTLTTNPNTNNETNYDTFTNINSKIYSPKEGLQIKTNEIRVEDYTRYGWGTSSDYSDLPSAVTDRLFSASIINELNNAQTAGQSSAIDWNYLKSFAAGGVTFLKKSSYNLWDPYDSIIWNSDNTYYIVAIYDYITPSKLTSDDSTTASDFLEIEQYAIDVGYEIASGSTFTSSAIEYFIEESALTYFDQDVFDYFVSTYPGLFD